MTLLLENHAMTLDCIENIKKRKYSENILQYGFISLIIARIWKLQCLPFYAKSMNAILRASNQLFWKQS